MVTNLIKNVGVIIYFRIGNIFLVKLITNFTNNFFNNIF